VRSQEYGSGHYKLDGTPGQDALPLAAHLSADGRTVLLVVPGMRPAMQMELDYDLRTAGSGAARAPVRDTLYLTVHAADTLDLAAAGFGALDWRASMRRAEAAARASVAVRKDAPRVAATAAEGARVYQRAGCMGCHSVDGTTAGKTGPTFRGLYGATRPLTNGGRRVADGAYLTQSILDPASEIVRGYEPGMPSFRGILKDAELESVILYIRSLGGRPAR
jgi:cytochrome c2